MNSLFQRASFAMGVRKGEMNVAAMHDRPNQLYFRLTFNGIDQPSESKKGGDRCFCLINAILNVFIHCPASL